MSTSAVNANCWLSSSSVISTSGWPRAKTSLSSTARPYRPGSASLTASCRTAPRPTYWSLRRAGTLPGRNPLRRTCCEISLDAFSRLGFSSSKGTSTVILTRVGLSSSTSVFTLGGLLDPAAARISQWMSWAAALSAGRGHVKRASPRLRAPSLWCSGPRADSRGGNASPSIAKGRLRLFRRGAHAVRGELAPDPVDLLRRQQPRRPATGARAQVDLAEPLQVAGLRVGLGERRPVGEGAVVAEEAGRTDLQRLDHRVGELGGAVRGVRRDAHGAAEHGDQIVDRRDLVHECGEHRGGGRMGVHDRPRVRTGVDGEVHGHLAGGFEGRVDGRAVEAVDADQRGRHLVVVEAARTDRDEIPGPYGDVPRGPDHEPVGPHLPAVIDDAPPLLFQLHGREYRPAGTRRSSAVPPAPPVREDLGPGNRGVSDRQDPAPFA